MSQPRRPLFLLSLLALTAPLASQSSHTGPLVPALPPPAVNQVRVWPLFRLTDFSRNSVNVNFEGFDAAGDKSLGDMIGLYGLRLRLGQGGTPAVWRDFRPRNFPPLGRAALSNRNPEDILTDPRKLVKDPDEECALVATFAVPVNRVAWEMRRSDGDELNVVVHCLRNGIELGRQFFDVGPDFRLIGVQCTEPFDELRLDLTNPSVALFSIDNVRHELDQRDRDHDGVPDFADFCPDVPGASAMDSDGDGMGDECDPFPFDEDNDIDHDGLGKRNDNCPLLFNPDQRDSDGDGVGDTCDELLGSDQDGDGIQDSLDNCPSAFNPEQADCDLDGIGDVCDPTLIDPAAVSFGLVPGQCVTVTKNVCLPPAPPVVDVAIVFDTTGSMGGEIAALRNNLVSFVNGVRQTLPLSDIRFALVDFKDYPNRYNSCGYSGQYSLPTDAPFTVVTPIGGTDLQLVQAVNSLSAQGGQDQPEAYARALWELSQPDSGLNFRPGSARFAILVGDAPPHDCNVGAGLAGCVPQASLGRDPGRDGLLFTPDDVDFQEDALRGLVTSHTRVLMLFTGLSGSCAWQRWCQVTGGKAIVGSPQGALPPGTNLVQELVDLIRTPIVNQVTIRAENPCGLDVSFEPPVIQGPIDVTFGSQVSFVETICVPAGLPAGPLDCEVRIFADDVLLGVQSIHVDVGCSLYTLDFETEDDFATPLGNAQTVTTPPEFGRLVRISSAGSNLGCTTFDSTPGGPNDPSINSDMLIGHGNLLLLQDNRLSQQTVPGFFDSVTDDPDGGDMIFDFTSPVDPKSVLLADINPPPNLGASVTLIDGSDRQRVYTVQPGWTGTYGNAGPWRLDLTTLAAQPGNGTPRFATAAEDQGFEQVDVVRIVVHMTGYGAMDELVFCR